ncbi:sensor histidine kinase [Actinokineospora sp.]|uniref:sensor histidine kinase n=1 Tax=Actinokineospora sp. TaxID=1872133 RepID=UPI0040384383
MDGTATAFRRQPRDWLVDVVLFLCAAAYGVLTASASIQDAVPHEPSWIFVGDQIAGVLGCAALWLRRRWPVHLAVGLIVLSSVSELIAGAMLAALFTVAANRPTRTTAVVFSLSLLAALVYVAVRPDGELPGVLLLMIGVVVQCAVVGWGLFVHHQRQLVAHAQTEARLRSEQAQQRARETVAREMHDVLGHRLSLLSVHAGALEYRANMPPEDVARSAKVIRESAHQALKDLRDVLHVLRAPVNELPHPTYADIRRLVTESGDAGMKVVLRDQVAEPVPDGLGRACYRIVQEALTNARKHAPGTEVAVRLAGSPGGGLDVEVCNSAPAAVHRPAAARPGYGLVGLAERVALAAGRIEHGPTEAGGWRLWARIPWAA